MWPLAMSHLENSKLAPSTAGWKTQSIDDFASDPDAVLEATQARRVYPGAPRERLPRPRAWGGIWTILKRRRTAREFSSKPVPKKTLAALLHGAAGVTGEIPVPGSTVVQCLRAWPSAGALYPIELYAVDASGAYHFDPVDAVLEQTAAGPMLERLRPSVLTLAREFDAPLAIVLTGVPERVMKKYGERGYRFLWLDAGHLAQNLILAATALGLGVCPIGGFYEDAVRAALSIDPRETPLYLLAMGYPR